MTVFRCAAASEGRGEPLLATASQVDRWLLVEQPGPWDEASLPASPLGAPTTAALQAQASELGARLLLIRRPGRQDAGRAGRTVFFVDSRPGRARVLRRHVADPTGLAALPLRGGWQRDEAPLYLVCAHGRHDVCCAVRGRPVAAALLRAEPEATWECSHVGGDRFAPNVLVLPGGLYYGRLPVEQVDALVAATRSGRVLAPWLRGRSSYPPAVQAAQHYLRAAALPHLDADVGGVDALAPLRQEQRPDGSVRVVLNAAPAEVAVTVRRTVAPEAVLLTCGATETRHPPGFALVGLEVLVPAL